MTQPSRNSGGSRPYRTDIMFLAIVELILGISSLILPMPGKTFTDLSQVMAFLIVFALVIGVVFGSPVALHGGVLMYFFDLVLHIIIISYDVLNDDHFKVGSMELMIVVASRCLMGIVGILTTFPYALRLHPLKWPTTDCSSTTFRPNSYPSPLLDTSGLTLVPSNPSLTRFGHLNNTLRSSMRSGSVPLRPREPVTPVVRSTDSHYYLRPDPPWTTTTTLPLPPTPPPRPPKDHLYQQV